MQVYAYNFRTALLIKTWSSLSHITLLNLGKLTDLLMGQLVMLMNKKMHSH